VVYYYKTLATTHCTTYIFDTAFVLHEKLPVLGKCRSFYFQVASKLVNAQVVETLLGRVVCELSGLATY